jgi:hypothetical protein
MRHDMGETSISLEKNVMIGKKVRFFKGERSLDDVSKLKICKCISYTYLTVI